MQKDTKIFGEDETYQIEIRVLEDRVYSLGKTLATRGSDEKALQTNLDELYNWLALKPVESMVGYSLSRLVGLRTVEFRNSKTGEVIKVREQMDINNAEMFLEFDFIAPDFRVYATSTYSEDYVRALLSLAEQNCLLIQSNQEKTETETYYTVETDKCTPVVLEDGVFRLKYQAVPHQFTNKTQAFLVALNLGAYVREVQTKIIGGYRFQDIDGTIKDNPNNT